MSKLVHPELSYTVRGLLFDVYNTLGPTLGEKYYRDAIAVGLEARKVSCQVEKPFEVYYEGERAGLYYVDLWLDGGKVLPMYPSQNPSYSQSVPFPIRCSVPTIPIRSIER